MISLNHVPQKDLGEKSFFNKHPILVDSYTDAYG
jgi:hypothetical protein